ncbi:MAG: glycoside hydrolase family 130 protein [Kiritimatiellae bacterium]|nr:glycoside hydrolase family 130 protein [Kiritimatiellia bacterium]
MNNNPITRANLVLRPDPARVLLRPFLRTDDARAKRICESVIALPEEEVQRLWEQVQTEFGQRHERIDEFLQRRFEQIRLYLPGGEGLSRERRLLLGSYFSHEYSLEAAALFNPSMVPHPDQSGLPEGALRFIMSLRATGEGHISSITFRSGTLDAQSHIALTPASRYCFEPVQAPSLSYEKGLFERKIQELGLEGRFSRHLLRELPDVFTLEELRKGALRVKGELRALKQQASDMAQKVVMLAQSNYEVQFTGDSNLSERVLFPTTPSQSNGIEDARFVQFENEDGSKTYYATYTAYDGRMILPQFIETTDFLHFKFITLNGPAVKNKGMALFPRKIQGHYAMLGRQDYENIYLMFSDHLHFWNTTQIILKPRYPWEYIQMGNCGSPIETEAGWLVLSHGVGAMRKYSISAFLLDRDDPSRVIGRLREPLITPNENEREGYVPNVVYSCGSLVHKGQLIIPYAMSDSASTFATLPLDDILVAME